MSYTHFLDLFVVMMCIISVISPPLPVLLFPLMSLSCVPVLGHFQTKAHHRNLASFLLLLVYLPSLVDISDKALQTSQASHECVAAGDSPLSWFPHLSTNITFQS